HPTTYTLDLSGQPLKVQTPDGATRTWTRDFAGQATSATDALGHTTTFTYLYGAGAGDLTRIDYPDGTNEQVQYDATCHHLAVRQDQRGNKTTYTYDGTTGDLLAVRNALNQVTTQTWSSGLLQTITDALSHTTSFTYEAGTRRLQAVIGANSGRVTFGYD